MMMSLLAVLATALITGTVLESRIRQNYTVATQLLYMAEAGIERGREALRRGEFPYIEEPSLQVTFHEDFGIPTLRSTSSIGDYRKTIEVIIAKGGFPHLPAALAFPDETLDHRLRTTAGLERIVQGIRTNATEVYEPAIGAETPIGNVGNADNYRVVVVDGDCLLGPGTGFGVLLVRGHLRLSGSFNWTGLILVIGQGRLTALEDSAGQIVGAVFIARTLSGPGTPAVDFSLAEPVIQWDSSAIDKANRVFPYVPVAYREY